jgi:predicted nucleic acid-binding protein
VIHLDTSVLIDAFTGTRRAAPALRGWIRDGERLGVCTIVLYEWWRGPRTREEREDQEMIVPSAASWAFGSREAELAARIYASLKRPRGRELDIAIAACAIVAGASLWARNPRDFADIPGLETVRRSAAPDSPQPPG